MSTQQEHILNQAKQNYLASAEKARDAKQRALEQYNREQDVGLVDNEMTFNDWVSGKDPAFVMAYNDYASKKSELEQILATVDETAFQEFQQKTSKELSKLVQAKEDWQWAIITPDI